MRTNRTYADAAVAHAAFDRSWGNTSAAKQPHSLKRPFNLVVRGQFETVSSLHSVETIEMRDKASFRCGITNDGIEWSTLVSFG